MPAPLLKAYAKESGKSLEDAEECWDKAKRMAEGGPFKNEKKDGHYWAFVNTETRKCLGLSPHPVKKK